MASSASIISDHVCEVLFLWLGLMFVCSATAGVQKRLMEYVRRGRKSDLMHPNTPVSLIIVCAG